MKLMCPDCQKSFQADDAARGKRVRCPGCQQAFTAEPPAPQPAPPPDEDAPPAGRGKKKSLLPVILIGCGALVLLCGGLGSAGGYFAWRAVRDDAKRRAEAKEGQIREEMEKIRREASRREEERIKGQERNDRAEKERPPDPLPPKEKPPVGEAPIPEPEEFLAPGPPAPPEPPAADVVSRVEQGVQLDVPSDRINFVRWGGRGSNRVVIASRTQAGKLRLQEYDTTNGRKTAQVDLPSEHYEPPQSLSPDGQYFLSRTPPPGRSGEDTFAVWSLTDGKPLVQKWSLDIRKVVRRPGQRPSREPDHISEAFLLSGRRVLTAHESGQVALWTLPETAGQAPQQAAHYEPTAEVARYPRGRYPSPVTLSPDRSRLAMFNGSDGFVILDTSNLQSQGVLKSPEDGRQEKDDFNGVLGAAFSPDGTQLAALFWAEKPYPRRPANLPPPRPPVLVRWDVQSKQRLARFDDPSTVPTDMDVIRPGIAWWGPDHCWVTHGRSGAKLVSWDRPRVVLRVDLGREYGWPEFGPTDDKCWLLISSPGGRAVLKYVPLPGEALKSPDQPLRLTYHGILRK